MDIEEVVRDGLFCYECEFFDTCTLQCNDELENQKLKIKKKAKRR